MAETAFAPLLDPQKLDNPSFMNTPDEIAAAKALAPTAKQPISPIIPQALAPNTIEAKLKAEGSGSSWLTTTLAILGAAKGDFRGLQAIEESKRRTALAKSIIPEMTRVNELVQSGKWEEASSYVNELTGSYGARADYLVPYFTQMQADIKKKQEGWKNLQGVYEYLKEKVPPNSPRYSTVEALRKATERRDQISETTLQGMLTRSQPHIQYLDNRMIAVDPDTLSITSQNMPQMMSEARVNNFGGNTVASRNSINTAQLADVMNNVPVKTDSGAVIQPNSKEAQQIKTQYNALQPVNAALEVAKLVPLEPTQMLQLLKEHGLMEIATRSFGGKSGAVEKALTEHYGRLTEQQAAIEKAKIENSPTELRKLGVPVHFDPSNPESMLTEVQDATLTIDAVRKSGGTIKIIRPEVYDNEVKKAQAGIQSLALIPSMLSGPNAPKTTGDRLAGGVIQYASSWLGYALDDKVTARENIKTILRTAIEQVENSFGDKIAGPDRVELGNLKAYATGDFATVKQILDATKQTQLRLSQIINRAVGVNPYFQNATQGIEQPTTKREVAKSPVSTIVPLIPQQRGIAQKGKGIDPALEAELDRVEGIARQASGPGGGTFRIPVGGTAEPLTSTAPTVTQPTGPEAEKAAIKARLDAKVQQRETTKAASRIPDIPPNKVVMPPQVTAPYQPNITPQQLSPLQPLQGRDVTMESERQRVLREIAVIRAKELADREGVQAPQQPDRYKAMRDAIYEAARAEAARKKKR